MTIQINGTTGISGVDGSAGTPALQGTDTNTGIAFGSDVILASTGGTERFRCDSSGRMLVGTSTSVGQGNWGGTGWTGVLQVSRNDVDGVAQFTNWSSSASLNGGTSLYISRCKSGTTGTQTGGGLASGDAIGRINFNGSDGSAFYTGASIDAIVDAATSGGEMPSRLVFSTTADGASSPTEHARITSDGYFKASSNGSYSSIVVTGHQLYQTASDWTTLFVNTAASLPYGIYVRYTGTSPNNTGSPYFAAYDNGPTLRAEIRSNGGLANFSANNANLSDRNAKKDISPAAGTWNCIKEWEIVNYRYKDQPDDADLNLGVIAQQVAESCPEVITVFEEAKDDQPEKLGIKEQQMYWMAIKALQEAQLRIESLETRLAALEVTP